MDEEIVLTLQDQLIADLTTELQGDNTFNKSVLKIKVVNAIKEVKRERRYPSSYTDEMIDEDLDRYYSNIRAIALYDYNQVGVEGQQSHSEGGVNRTWVDRKSLFNGVLPLSRV